MRARPGFFVVFALASAPACATGWSGPVAVSGVTDSVKWTVRAVPDGAGGAVCVWEENRGRKVCCRDTRDLWAQRLDAAGSRVWAPRDVAVAVQDAGEELLGLAASSGGGALVWLRRGNGSLILNELSPGGTLLHGAAGRELDASAGNGEWLPGNGFAMSGDGRAAALVYALPVEAGVAVRVIEAVRDDHGWTVSAPVEVDRAMGLHPGAIAWCGTRWLVATWSEAADGVRTAGRWMEPGTRALSPPFDLGGERGRNWVWLQAAGDGAGGAWLVRAAVDAAAYSRTHTATVVSVTAGARGTVVRRMPLGAARTAAMFIPPVLVGTGDQAAAAATAPVVAWRPTSWVIPAGRDRAWGLRVVDGRLEAAAIRRTAAGVTAGPARTVARGISDAFTPAAWSRGDGSITVVWGRTADGGVRLETTVVRDVAGRSAAGPVAVVAAGRSPRVGAAVEGPGASPMLVWTDALGPETGMIHAMPMPTESR